MRISVQLEQQSNELPGSRPILPEQKLILENIPMVEQLSISDRQRLEAEVMQLILSAELDIKLIVGKESPHLHQQVNNEYKEFLKAVRLKELYIVNADAEVAQCSGDANNASVNLLSDDDSSDDVIVLPDNSNKSPCSVPAPFKVKPELSILTPETLLEPLSQNQWIPVSEAAQYVRPCYVKLKRTNLEDYIPLAKIKREFMYQSLL